MPKRIRTKPAIERIDRAAADIEQHGHQGHYPIPVECQLEFYKAMVQLFAEGLVDGTLRYGEGVESGTGQ